MQTPQDIRRLLDELDPEILCADGFDDALIGYVEVFSQVVALYDRERCIEILEASGLSNEEAVEHFEFNVVGAYAGRHTPAFATVLRQPRIVGGGPEFPTEDLEQIRTTDD